MNRLLLSVALVFFGGVQDVPDKNEPITVHVKEVNRVDGEYSEEGLWFKVTAVMESQTIIYQVKM
jgi:hypothetical protein